MRRLIIIVLVALVLPMVTAATSAAADLSPVYPTPALLKSEAASAEDLKLPAKASSLGMSSSLYNGFFKPDGDGPFPALVLPRLLRRHPRGHAHVGEGCPQARIRRRRSRQHARGEDKLLPALAREQRPPREGRPREDAARHLGASERLLKRAHDATAFIAMSVSLCRSLKRVPVGDPLDAGPVTPRLYETRLTMLALSAALLVSLLAKRRESRGL